jgi:hypothetical protein
MVGAFSESGDGEILDAYGERLDRRSAYVPFKTERAEVGIFVVGG